MQWNYPSLNVPLKIISCTRSWNFAWHLLWRLTTESKNIIKLLEISRTIHTVCCKDDYFPKGKFKLFKLLLNLYLIVCFTQCTLFFQKVCFLLPICLPCVVCSEDNCCVATQRAADIRVAWLVYVRMYCVRMASLNEDKRTRLLYLGDAQIISLEFAKHFSEIQ